MASLERAMHRTIKMHEADVAIQITFFIQIFPRTLFLSLGRREVDSMKPHFFAINGGASDCERSVPYVFSRTCP